MRLTPEVKPPQLRAWQARAPYAAAGLFILFGMVGVALEVVQQLHRASEHVRCER